MKIYTYYNFLGRAQSWKFTIRNGTETTRGVQQSRQSRFGSSVQGPGRMGSRNRSSGRYWTDIVGC